MSWSDVGRWVKTYGQNLASEVSGGGPAAHKAFTKKNPGDSSTSAVTGISTNSGMTSPGIMDSGYAEGGYPSAKRGGKVRKAGLVKLHRGEIVLTRSQSKTFSRKKGHK